MASLHDALNRVWATFRMAGIADDLQILRFVGQLLVTEKLEQRDTNLLAKLEQAFDESQLNHIKSDLRQAAELAGGSGNLFDRYVLFRLSTMLTGGRYFTPRHIVLHLVHLIDVAPNHRMADFACGSGGFLIHRGEVDSGKDNLSWGFELSEEIAQLAITNVALHDRADVQIEVGNALRIVKTSEQYASMRFDRIAMNPPFGARIDTNFVVGQISASATSSRSETALTELALEKLDDGGYAAVLVPSGVLFSSSAAELNLRRRMIHEFSLRAVIALPDGAMEPFSQQPTNLLIVAKEEHSTDYTWFFREQDDGYPAGRNRDLTAEPRAFHDLVVVERALSLIGSNDQLTPKYSDLTWTIFQIDENEVDRWFVLETKLLAAINEIDLYPPNDNFRDFLIIILNSGADIQHWKFPLAETESVELIPDVEQFLRARFNVRARDALPARVVIHSGTPLRRAVFLGNGRLLGVQIETAVVQKRNYEMQPASYIAQPAEVKVTKSPAALLNDIDSNRERLNLHVSRLRRYLGRVRNELKTLPSPVLRSDDGSPIEPIGMLSLEQKRVWQSVRKQTAPHPELEGVEVPVPFQPKDLEGASDSAQRVREITATLELFERMGLLVPIHYAIPGKDNPSTFFRLVSEADNGLLTVLESSGTSS